MNLAGTSHLFKVQDGKLVAESRSWVPPEAYVREMDRTDQSSNAVHFRDLVKELAARGIVVDLVTHEKLKDYAGMNWLAARYFGYPCPVNRIEVDFGLDIDTKLRTLRHEACEVYWMLRGYSYWQAHKQALLVEGDFETPVHLPTAREVASRKITKRIKYLPAQTAKREANRTAPGLGGTW